MTPRLVVVCIHRVLTRFLLVFLLSEMVPINGTHSPLRGRQWYPFVLVTRLTAVSYWKTVYTPGCDTPVSGLLIPLRNIAGGPYGE